jgi:D-alanine transaminase
VKDGTLWTHPANNLILHGITREVTLKLAEKLNIPVHYETFDTNTLLSADECFMTSTTMEICPIVKVDGQTIGKGVPGSITRQLQEAFEQEIALLTAASK